MRIPFRSSPRVNAGIDGTSRAVDGDGDADPLQAQAQAKSARHPVRILRRTEEAVTDLGRRSTDHTSPQYDEKKGSLRFTFS